MIPPSLQAADEIAKHGIEAEVTHIFTENMYGAELR